MRLTVNGIQVRVVDRIEIVIEVSKDGDTILNGVDIEIKGGVLTIDNAVTLRGPKDLRPYLHLNGGPADRVVIFGS